jgi:hypothetical protein
MNRCTVILIFFFLLKVFRDLTINALIKYFYLKAPRKVSGIFYIIIRQ